MHPHIKEIFETEILYDGDNNPHKLQAHIDKSEGQFLVDLIKDHPIEKTLEVGCAFGIASLFICSALENKDNPEHTIVDPYQTDHFSNTGIANLESAGFKFYRFFEELSEFKLPELAAKEAGSFDLVFIDGFHTFDHTLLDLFYANRLIRKGGFIVVDDCNMPGVSKAISYFSNYPAYTLYSMVNRTKNGKKLKYFARKLTQNRLVDLLCSKILPNDLYNYYYTKISFESMVALQKKEEDLRPPNWFQSF